MSPALKLSNLPIGVLAHVVSVAPAIASDEAHELTVRLQEIGFIGGEPVKVIAHGFPGREPIAVRVGRTTFALRRFEADQVRVAVAASASPLDR